MSITASRISAAHEELDREVSHLEHHADGADFIAECGGQAAYDARYSETFRHFMALDMIGATDAEVQAAVEFAEAL